MFASAYLLGFGRALSLKEPPPRFEGALCRFGFFAGEGASSNIVVLRRDIAQVIRWKPPYCPHRSTFILIS